jgi:hypothetical protein
MKLNTRYAVGSLRIRYVAVEGTVMIDPDTGRNLELVDNMAHKKSPHSLFGCVRSHASCHSLLTTHRDQKHARSYIYCYGVSASAGQYSFTHHRYRHQHHGLLSLKYNFYLLQAQSAIDARLDVVEGKLFHFLDRDDLTGIARICPV